MFLSGSDCSSQLNTVFKRFGKQTSPLTCQGPVVKGIKTKITAKFRALRRLRLEETKRIMSPKCARKVSGLLRNGSQVGSEKGAKTAADLGVWRVTQSSHFDDCVTSQRRIQRTLVVVCIHCYSDEAVFLSQ